MATYIKTFEKELSAGGADIEVGKLTPSEKENYHLLSLSFSLAGNGKLEGFIERELIYDLKSDMEANANHPVPIDVTLTSATPMTFIGTDLSGAANKMMVMVVYEIVAVT